MIKLFSTILVGALMSTAVLAQNSKKGSGNVTTENRTVTSFSKIDASGVYNVVLKQGDKEEVIVETDDNLQDLVTVENSGETLKLGMKSNANYKKTTKMLVTVTFKNIDAINNKLVGNLKSEGSISLEKLDYDSKAVGNTNLEMNVTNLDMNLKSVGNTTFSGKSTECKFINKSVGNFDGEEFAVTNMELANKAVGNTAVNVENLQFESSGVGRVTNKKKKLKSNSED